MKLTRKEYGSPEEKKKDYWRGFWLWWGINIVMAIIFGGLTALLANSAVPGDDFANTVALYEGIGLNFLPFLINTALIIYLALTRSQMALGMLVAFGVALAIVIVLGIVLAVVCFAFIASYNP